MQAMPAEAGQERRAPRNGRLTTSATIAESITVNDASMENSRKMISTPKNTPVIGALKVAGDPAARRRRRPGSAAGSPASGPLPEAGGQRGADLHDRAFPATDPPAPMQSAEASALTGDLRADPAAVLGDRDHHLGHAVPAGLPRVPVDQRAVDRPPMTGMTTKNPSPSQGRWALATWPCWPNWLMPGRQPGEEVDQVPERHRAQPRPAPTTSATGTARPARPAATRPPGRPAAPLRPVPPRPTVMTVPACCRSAQAPVPPAAAVGSAGHWLSGISPAAAANAASALATADAAGAEPAQDAGDQRPPPGGRLSTTSRPAAVTETCTARRSARAGAGGSGPCAPAGRTSAPRSTAYVQRPARSATAAAPGRRAPPAPGTGRSSCPPPRRPATRSPPRSGSGSRSAPRPPRPRPPPAPSHPVHPNLCA